MSFPNCRISLFKLTEKIHSCQISYCFLIEIMHGRSYDIREYLNQR